MKERKLQSGRVLQQLDKEVHMTISSKCPDKWLFVDMETGNIWHRREGEDNQKKAIGHFWRSATETEKRELRRLIMRR